jgi:hypothetical protein
MPALKERSASLSAAMQLPLNDASSRETEEATKVGASTTRKRRRHTRMAAAPQKKQDRGVAAIALFWFSFRIYGNLQLHERSIYRPCKCKFKLVGLGSECYSILDHYQVMLFFSRLLSSSYSLNNESIILLHAQS